mmetsp:Transcript_29382/g.67643  ORF Transcript_29382/g.67643 Transcript_29382/m.67643 type:complete len:375 (-) Transcript_29382:291-1415(-)
MMLLQQRPRYMPVLLIHLVVSSCIARTAALQLAVITSSGESALASDPNRTTSALSKAILDNDLLEEAVLQRQADMQIATPLDPRSGRIAPANLVVTAQESIRVVSLAAIMFIILLYIVAASLQKLQVTKRSKVHASAPGKSQAQADRPANANDSMLKACFIQAEAADCSTNGIADAASRDEGSMRLELLLPREVPSPAEWNHQIPCRISASSEAKSIGAWPELVVAMKCVGEGTSCLPSLEVLLPAAGRPRLIDIDASMRLTQADGCPLGQLRAIGASRYILEDSSGLGTMAVSCSPSGDSLELGSLQDGRRCALAKRDAEGLLTISVQRSADPAIALACTMAIVLLAPLNLWKQGFSSLSLASIAPPRIEDKA